MVADETRRLELESVEIAKERRAAVGDVEDQADTGFAAAKKEKANTAQLLTGPRHNTALCMSSGNRNWLLGD